MRRSRFGLASAAPACLVLLFSIAAGTSRSEDSSSTLRDAVVRLPDMPASAPFKKKIRTSF